MNKNIESFNRKSEQYAQARPRYPSELYAHLLTLVEDRQRLWDCACGNGQVAIDLADHFAEVHATDISENQIENAFQHEKIRYSVTPSEHTHFPEHFFDLVCVAQALHWFQIQHFFAELDRVLKPSGIFACFAYGFFHINEAIDDILNRHLLTPVDPYWSEGNRLAKSGLKSVRFPFREVKVPEYTMTLNWDLNTLLNYLGTWSAVKRYNEAHTEAIVQRLKTALLPVWKENETKEVRMDFYAYIRKK